MPYTETGLPFAPGSHTSYKSAASIQPGQRGYKTRQYLLVLACEPATDHEMARRLYLPISSITSIRNALMQAGLVNRRPEERLSQYGKSCATWGLSSAGYAAVKALEQNA
jgi:hypothetical protein